MRVFEPFSNFSRRSPKEHFCEIILKSNNWPMKRCRLKTGGHSVQRSRTILALLVKGHQRNFFIFYFFFIFIFFLFLFIYFFFFCEIILKSGHWSRKR